jgi:hypothetical protein
MKGEKMDLLHKFLKAIDHNRWTVISIIVFALIMTGIVTSIGCQSKTMALVGPPEQVNRQTFNTQVIEAQGALAIKKVQLDAQVASYNEEVNTFNAKVEAGETDLDKQDEFRQQIVDVVGLIATEAATTGGLNLTALIPLGIGLGGAMLGLGLGGDNRRKDKEITKLKNGNN